MSEENENVIAAPQTASMVTDLLDANNIPHSTFFQFVQEHGGPKMFRIGRRKYCRHADFDAWLSKLADAGCAA